MEKHPGQLKQGPQLQAATPATLKDLGLEKTQAHRWQTIASLPEPAFEDGQAEDAAD